MVTKVLPVASTGAACEGRLHEKGRGVLVWQYAAPSESDVRDLFNGTTLSAEGSRGVMWLDETLQPGVSAPMPRFIGNLLNLSEMAIRLEDNHVNKQSQE